MRDRWRNRTNGQTRVRVCCVASRLRRTIVHDTRLLDADTTAFTAISETQASHSVPYLASVDDCGSNGQRSQGVGGPRKVRVRRAAAMGTTGYLLRETARTNGRRRTTSHATGWTATSRPGFRDKDTGCDSRVSVSIRIPENCNSRRRVDGPLRYHSPVLTFAAMFHSHHSHIAPQRRPRHGSAF